MGHSRLLGNMVSSEATNLPCRKYMVVETRESMFPIVTEFSNTRHMGSRPVHHYSRLERFRATLYHLTGTSGKVPVTKQADITQEDVFDLIERNLEDYDPDTIWVRVDLILGKHSKDLEQVQVRKIFQ